MGSKQISRIFLVWIIFFRHSLNSSCSRFLCQFTHEERTLDSACLMNTCSPLIVASKMVINYTNPIWPSGILYVHNTITFQVGEQRK